MIRAVIIDDEQDARDTISGMINLFAENITVVGEGHDVKSGIQVIKEQKPDVVFLDIQMPDGTGFNLLEYFNNKINFKVIFVTAYEQHALKAFKFHAFDYILKPVSPEDFINTVKNVESSLDDTNLKLTTYLENANASNKKKKLAIRTAEEVLLINIEDIIHLESDVNYTTIFLKDKKIITTTTLKEYDEMLSDLGFFRAHKTHLINLDHIVKFKKEDGGSVIMSNEHVIPVSRRKKDELMTIMNSL